MKRLFLVFALILLSFCSFGQQVNFVSTSFYNSTTCEVTIQVGLQRKTGGCGNTIAIAAVDFTLQWSSDLLLVSSGFIPAGEKLDDGFYFASVGPDTGPPQIDVPPFTGNTPNTHNKGASGIYKSSQIRRSTSKCDNIILLDCGMIVPFFSATFRLADCASANQYSFTYNHTAGADNSNYIAEFITDSLAAPTNTKKEILIYSNQTASFDNVSGNCNGENINNTNVLTAKIDSNNFVNTYGAILPVILDYFKARQKQPKTVDLEWASLSEFNHLEFVVERSIDQKSWNSIGNVPSAGNGNIRRVYQLTDPHPFSGQNFYRLKQIDVEGRISYSSVVRINTSVTKVLSVFPNPVVNVTQLSGKESFKTGQTILVIDAKGTRIKIITPTSGNRLQIDLSGYSAGLYLMQLIENGKVIENLQVVKQ
jgi:hypothetical protein